MNKVLVIAPHPDDETLGCGGSLFRHKKEGDKLFWLIITNLHLKEGWSKRSIKQRDDEIRKVSESYQFEEKFILNYKTTKVDIYPIADIIEEISIILKKIGPQVIYMPYANDVHTDHYITANAIQSSIKWFRCPSINKVLMYETLSETNFNFFGFSKFNPNVYLDISKYINQKIETMNIYSSELGIHPFPRSEKVIKAQATLRGSQSGFEAAEAFQLVYERK